MKTLVKTEWQKLVVASVAIMSAITSVSVMADDKLPAPVQALQAQGLKVIDSFSAPGGLTGYAASANGRPLILYVTADGEHAIIGTMVDKDGENLSAEPVEKLIMGPQNKKAWSLLESESAWVADGSDKAKHIVYMFDDPECPYCHRFWQATRSWVDSGQVQIRHVLVGVISAKSPDESAAILAAKDPAKALADHMNSTNSGKPTPLDISTVTDKARQQVSKNEDLTSALNVGGTPSIYYPKADDSIGFVGGMPQPGQLAEVMGSPDFN